MSADFDPRVEYTVIRDDGQDRPGCKYEDGIYYVLDMVHDPYAPAALAAYAAACRADYPGLAAQLDRYVVSCRGVLDDEP